MFKWGAAAPAPLQGAPRGEGGSPPAFAGHPGGEGGKGKTAAPPGKLKKVYNHCQIITMFKEILASHRSMRPTQSGVHLYIWDNEHPGSNLADRRPSKRVKRHADPLLYNSGPAFNRGPPTIDCYDVIRRGTPGRRNFVPRRGGRVHELSKKSKVGDPNARPEL